MNARQVLCPNCGSDGKSIDRNLLGAKDACPRCFHVFGSGVSDDIPVLSAFSKKNTPPVFSASLPDKNGQDSKLNLLLRRTIPSRFEGIVRPNEHTLGVGVSVRTAGIAKRVRAMQTRNVRRARNGFCAGMALVIIVSLAAYIAAIKTPVRQPVVTNTGVIPPKHIVGARRETNTNDVADDEVIFQMDRATTDAPVDLQFIPFGTQVALNIRPSSLWEKGGSSDEIRSCLIPLANVLETTLQDLFHQKPAEIDEVLICLIPSEKGTLPKVAAVVRLVKDVEESRLLEEIGGHRNDDYGRPVYLSGNRAYLIYNLKTIAVCPREQAREMVLAIDGRNVNSDGIDKLLTLTDRRQHITIIFVPRTLRLHSEFWFTEVNPSRASVRSFCDWLGIEVEAVAWSFHFGSATFCSNMLLRSMPETTGPELARNLQRKLDHLPQELLSAVRAMDPQPLGRRRIIGRVPIMSEAFSMATSVTLGRGYVRLNTQLPERAAPNLALGSMLFWDEATHNSFTKTTPMIPVGIQFPGSMIDRLRQKIDVDFRRTSLQDALTYIGGEINTAVEFDEDALKSAGYTKNMPQDMKLDGEPAKLALHQILKKYQDSQRPEKNMVVVVDEDRKAILVTTQTACQKKSLIPFDLTE